MRVAAAFQEMMSPSSVMPMIASSEDSTIAPRKASGMPCSSCAFGVTDAGALSEAARRENRSLTPN
jgi:hypothetical protein